MPHRCIEELDDKEIKVEEGRRKAVFLNPGRLPYKRAKVDNCLITNGVRCDYFVSEDDKITVLIELKGCGVEHACDQLFSSVEHENVRQKINKKIGFQIICSRYPRVDTYVLKAKQAAARKYQAGFHICCDRGTFHLKKIASIT